ncbi:MAG: hypothetical protein ABI758_00540 [Candidatus Woesebacteria bacterium]
MQGIIIDGVASAGKTSVLKILQNKILENKFSSSKLFISEHYTQRMLEQAVENHEISGLMVQKHITTLIKSLDVYHKMLIRSKFALDPRGAEAFVTIERFILTYLATQPSLVEGYGLKKIAKHFKHMNKMNIKQYIFTLSSQNIEKNVSQTLKHRNKGWADYINARGGIKTVCSDYILWQENIVNFAHQFSGSINTEIVNLDNNNYEEIAQNIFDNDFSQKQI